eukprot:365951-Chlamydomonas_euryale.AAC.2
MDEYMNGRIHGGNDGWAGLTGARAGHKDGPAFVVSETLQGVSGGVASCARSHSPVTNGVDSLKGVKSLAAEALQGCRSLHQARKLLGRFARYYAKEVVEVRPKYVQSTSKFANVSCGKDHADHRPLIPTSPPSLCCIPTAPAAAVRVPLQPESKCLLRQLAPAASRALAPPPRAPPVVPSAPPAGARQGHTCSGSGGSSGGGSGGSSDGSSGGPGGSGRASRSGSSESGSSGNGGGVRRSAGVPGRLPLSRLRGSSIRQPFTALRTGPAHEPEPTRAGPTRRARQPQPPPLPLPQQQQAQQQQQQQQPTKQQQQPQPHDPPDAPLLQRPLLLLVDGHNLAYRHFWAMSRAPGGVVSAPSGVPTSITAGFLRTLLAAVRAERPAALGVVFDGGRSFRCARGDKRECSEGGWAWGEGGRCPSPSNLFLPCSVLASMHLLNRPRLSPIELGHRYAHLPIHACGPMCLHAVLYSCMHPCVHACMPQRRIG